MWHESKLVTAQRTGIPEWLCQKSGLWSTICGVLIRLPDQTLLALSQLMLELPVGVRLEHQAQKQLLYGLSRSYHQHVTHSQAPSQLPLSAAATAAAATVV